MTLQEQLDVFSNLSSVVADMNYLAPMAEAAAQLHVRSAAGRAAQQYRARAPRRGDP